MDYEALLQRIVPHNLLEILIQVYGNLQFIAFCLVCALFQCLDEHWYQRDWLTLGYLGNGFEVDLDFNLKVIGDEVKTT